MFSSSVSHVLIPELCVYVDGSPAATYKTHNTASYARPGYMSFDEFACECCNLVAKSFGRFGKSGYKPVTNALGRSGGGVVNVSSRI